MKLAKFGGVGLLVLTLAACARTPQPLSTARRASREALGG
jgi:hypothetical protein